MALSITLKNIEIVTNAVSLVVFHLLDILLIVCKVSVNTLVKSRLEINVYIYIYIKEHKAVCSTMHKVGRGPDGGYLRHRGKLKARADCSTTQK